MGDENRLTDLDAVQFGLPTLETAGQRPEVMRKIIDSFTASLSDFPRFPGNYHPWEVLSTTPDALVANGGVLVAKSVKDIRGGSGGGHGHISRTNCYYFSFESLHLQYPGTRQWLYFALNRSDTSAITDIFSEKLLTVNLDLDQTRYLWGLGFPLLLDELSNDDPKRQRAVDKVIDDMRPLTIFNPLGQEVVLPEGTDVFSLPGVFRRNTDQRGTKVYLGTDDGVSKSAFQML